VSGCGGIAPHFSTSTVDEGDWSASRFGRFTPQEKSPRYPLDRRLGGPRSRTGSYGEEKNLLPLLGIEPRLLGRPARSLVVIQTQLSHTSKKQHACLLGLLFDSVGKGSTFCRNVDELLLDYTESHPRNQRSRFCLHSFFGCLYIEGLSLCLRASTERTIELSYISDFKQSPLR
jgi:hypothetical protein